MTQMSLPLVVQLSLALGVAGLLWPEKLMSVFDVLLFPWASTHRMVRLNSIAAILLSVLLFFILLTRLA